jgi:hypothetical protein
VRHSKVGQSALQSCSTSISSMIIRLARMCTYLGDDAGSADVKERRPVCAMTTVIYTCNTSGLAQCTCMRGKLHTEQLHLLQAVYTCCMRCTISIKYCCKLEQAPYRTHRTVGDSEAVDLPTETPKALQTALYAHSNTIAVSECTMLGAYSFTSCTTCSH